MHFSQLATILAAHSLALAGVANAAYTISDSYDATNFFSGFDFFTAPDPTLGFVKYQAGAAANSSGLAKIDKGAVYLGVDSTTMTPAGGRNSVRVTSKKAFNRGLFVADIAHMPGSICGVWPAFWMFGPSWPNSGEIDIIEGVNTQATNAITLHTGPGCTVTTAGSAADTKLVNPNCNTNTGKTGCATETKNAAGYGNGFNAAGGGVYAMDWTSAHIKVWFFARNAIPADIKSGKPNPATWGVPTAMFSGPGCNLNQHFKNQNIVFNTTFCGEWAGAVWATGTCKALAPTCNDYVSKNPKAFANAFWTINSVKVYTDAAAKKREAVPVPFSA